ncbi:MAG: hypothetical protein WCW40_11320, partial [Bacteroidota bacterium]
TRTMKLRIVIFLLLLSGMDVMSKERTGIADETLAEVVAKKTTELSTEIAIRKRTEEALREKTG